MKVKLFFAFLLVLSMLHWLVFMKCNDCFCYWFWGCFK